MSHFDYIASRSIAPDFPFAACVMAAARRADTANFDKLRAAFPEIVDELQARYDAPGGRLPGDPR